MPDRARRYLVIVQAAQGYPERGEPLEAAPPDGPAQPVVHTAVLEADYEAAIADATLRAALVGVSNAYGCFAGCTGALPGAPEDGSGHTVACREARAALLPGALLAGSWAATRPILIRDA